VDVDLEGASVISVVALVFSAIGLWFGAVRPWWKTREAHPEARLELLSYQTKQGWTTDEKRLVILNHGPALMRGVNIRLVDEAGEQGRSQSLWPPLPIPEIHVGQALYLTLTGGLGDLPPRSAVLSWRDGRVRAQQRTFWLTWQRVT
jgi:hypothetical protein